MSNLTLAEKLRLRASYRPPAESWVAVLYGPSTETNYGKITAVCSDGSIVAVSQNSASDSVVALLDSGGALQWQRKLDASIQLVFIGQSDDIFVIGHKSGVAYVVKYNIVGVIQWQRRLYSANTVSCFRGGGNGSDVYLCCDEWDGARNSVVVAKYNSSGTLQWQTVISSASFNIFAGNAIEVNGGNLYLVGYVSRSPMSSYIIELNPSTGAAVSQRELTAAIDLRAVSLTVDDDIAYIAINGNSGNGLAVALNLNAWSVVFSRRQNTGSIHSVCSLPTGDVAFGAHDGHLFVVQTDADISFERSLSAASNAEIRGISTWNTAMILSGSVLRTSRGIDSFIAKYPQDGSALGAYGDIEYEETTDGLSTISVSISTSSLTIEGATLNDAAGVLSDTAGSLSHEVLTL